MRWAYRRFKTNREENLTNLVGFVYACEKNAKIEKLMMGKVATSRKSKTHNRQFKTRPISVCECFIVMLKMLH